MLSLNRKIYRAVNRTREGNFKLKGLLGFDMYGKTAGLVGMGRIAKGTHQNSARFRHARPGL